jgi:hypothetical protein
MSRKCFSFDETVPIIFASFADSCSESDCDDFFPVDRLEEAIDAVPVVGKGVDVAVVPPTTIKGISDEE